MSVITDAFIMFNQTTVTQVENTDSFFLLEVRTFKQIFWKKTRQAFPVQIHLCTIKKVNPSK